MDQGSDGSPGGGGDQESPPRVAEAEELSKLASEIHLTRPSLKEMVATRVLSLFSYSLLGTLAFAALLVLIDALFIYMETIRPEQRLMTERIIMTFVTATVVQVGAAIAAIVFAVFKTNDADAYRE
jgi:hypothetical protein